MNLVFRNSVFILGFRHNHCNASNQNYFLSSPRRFAYNNCQKEERGVLSNHSIPDHYQADEVASLNELAIGFDRVSPCPAR